MAMPIEACFAVLAKERRDEIVGQRGDRDRGGVAAQHRVRRHHGLDLLEDLVLELGVLEHGLDDGVAAREVGRIGGVSAVAVDLPTGQVTITSTTPIALDDVRAEVAEAGFG